MTKESLSHTGASSQPDSIDNEPLKIKRNSPLPALIGLVVLVGGIVIAVLTTLGGSNEETSTASAAIQVKDDAKKPIDGPVSKIEVSAETPIKTGQKLHIKWGDDWYNGSVLQVDSNGEITVRYENWGKEYDEVVSRDRLRLVE